jgi:hypothetical protein
MPIDHLEQLSKFLDIADEILGGVLFYGPTANTQ